MIDKKKKIFHTVLIAISTTLIILACFFVYKKVTDEFREKHLQEEYEIQEAQSRKNYEDELARREKEKEEALEKIKQMEDEKEAERLREEEEKQKRIAERESEKNKNAIFTLEDYPAVDASLAIHPLCDAIAQDFLDMSYDELSFSYTTTRTSDVYHNLIDGKCDVILAAEISDEDIAYAKEKNVELEIIPLTSSAFVFVTNVKNPVNGLTLEEVKNIYSENITNWNQVGGNDEEIIAYQRPVGSGSQTAMLNLVMKDKEIMNPPLEEIKAEMGGLIDAIADYDNSEKALGYSYFYYVNTMYKRDTIKMLAIDGVTPSIDTIKDGTYPLYTNGFIVYRKDESSDKDSNVIKWVDAILSERGSKVISDNGYVPLN